VGLLARGRPETVHQAATELLGAMRRRGHARFVLSSGCTLAMETPAENVHALCAAARAFGDPP
jgi:uroporphyrinogen-III decarboxylase